MGTLLAGCSDSDGTNDDTEDTDRTDGDVNGNDSTTQPSKGGGPFDCSDLSRGSQTVDPDGRPLQVIWDFPASWGDIEREMANAGSITGARLGHLASKRPGSWTYIIQLLQTTDPMDAETAERYIDNPVYEATDPIDYEGQAVSRSTYSMEDDDNRLWIMALPGQTAGEFYSMQVVLGIEETDDYSDCAEEAVGVAKGVMASFRPNPAI